MANVSQFQEANTFSLPGNYAYTSMVSHRGKLISFGMTDEGRIKYTVLDLSATEKAVDRDNWSDIKELCFPTELMQSGFEILNNFKMPPADSEGKLLDSNNKKNAYLIDVYWSSTAHLSSCASFQALSDGKHVYLFRQSGVYTDPTDSSRIIVDHTLLADRFILSGSHLISPREVRYQRSKHKTLPASRKDTLSSLDIENNPFYEPTREIGFVNHLSDGRFSVLQVPTEETEVSRWHFFFYNDQQKQLNSVSIKTHTDGWFDYSDANEHIDTFILNHSLHNPPREPGFAECVMELIREGLQDGEIATQLMASDAFKADLANASEDELTEVIYALRTGLVKDDFHFSGNYEISAGMSSIFYYQQEEDDETGKPLKTKASVMLAMGVTKTGEDKSYIAVLTFTVAKSGRLSRITTETLQLPDLDLASIDNHKLLQEISDLDSQINDIRDEISAKEINYRKVCKNDASTFNEYYRPVSTVTPKAGLISDEMLPVWLFPNLENSTQEIIEGYQNAIENLNTIADADAPNGVSLHFVESNGTEFTLGYHPGWENLDFSGSLEKVIWLDAILGGVYDDSCYVFIGEYYYLYNRYLLAPGMWKVADGYPKKISDTWFCAENAPVSFPSRIDSANCYREGDVAIAEFYSGQQRWTSRLLDNGNWEEPQLHINDSAIFDDCFSFPTYKGLTAHFYFHQDTFTFYLKGEGTEKQRNRFIQTTISDRWPGLPSNIDAAFIHCCGGHIYFAEFYKGFEKWFFVVRDYCNPLTDDVTISIDPFSVVQTVGFTLEKMDPAIQSSSSCNITDKWSASQSTDPEVKFYKFKISNSTEVKIIVQDISDFYAIPYAFILKSITLYDAAGALIERRLQADFDGYGHIASMNYELVEGTYVVAIAHHPFVGEDVCFNVLIKGATAIESVEMKSGAGILVRDDRITLNMLIEMEQLAIDDYFSDVTAKFQELRQLQSNREAKQEKEASHEGATVAMPLLQVDDDGLSTSGAILNFAYTADKPFLFDDSLGRVALYFQGDDNNRFYAAYFSPTVNQQVGHIPERLTGLSFKPRLPLDELNVDIDVTLHENCCDLVFGQDIHTLEKWAALPLESDKVAQVLNGFNRFKIGFLALKPEPGKELTISTTPDNGFFQWGEQSKLIGEFDSANATIAIPLGQFLQNNRQLSVNGRRFRINASTVSVSVLTFRKDDLKPVVASLFADVSNEEENKEELVKGASNEIWGYLEQQGIIKEIEDNSEEAWFLKQYLVEQEAELLLNFDIELSSDYEPIKAALVKLILNAVNRRQVHLNVEHLDESGELAVGSEVYVNYDYDNFQCYPNRLPVTVPETWQHTCSLLFKAASQSSIEMSEFTTKKLSIKSGMGQWVYPHPGHALSFNLTLASDDNGAKEAAVLTTQDKLPRLLPTSNGLAMEAWLHPRITDKEAKVIHYRDGKNTYSLGISPKNNGFSPFAIIENRRITTKSHHKFDTWTHLALSYRKFWGVNIDCDSSNAAISCGNTLGLQNEFTIELMLQWQGAGTVLLNKPGDYSVKLSAIGQVSMILDGQDVLLGNNLRIPRNKFCKLTIIRSRAKPKNFNSVEDYPLLSKQQSDKKSDKKWYDGLDSDEITKGLAERQDQMYESSMASAAFLNTGSDQDENAQNKYFYTLIIDNQSFTSELQEIEAEDTSYADLNMMQGFKGTFCGARFWARPLALEDAHKTEISSNNNALLAWWRLSEGQDKVLYDDAGQNHAMLTAEANFNWVDSPDKSPSRYQFYIDGVVKPVVVSDEFESAEENQFSLAGIVDGDFIRHHYDGIMDEVRIWGEARTAEEIHDNAFGSLKGDTEKLLAYYCFEKAPDETLIVTDSSHNNVDLQVKGIFWNEGLNKNNISHILTTAPVSEEIPVVRPALSGITKDYHDVISATPAICEYGDIQENMDGTFDGVLKRCYSYLKDGKWMLVTGYKVGNLITEWVGQAQFEPQVMGYIEGPPPLPGENFPITNDDDINTYAYILNNSATLQQAEEVSFEYTTTKESGYQARAESEMAFGLNFQVVLAPFGIGAMFKADAKIAAKTNWETAGNRAQTFGKGTSVTREMDFSVTQAGYHEGDYYVFGNEGYALVKSKTADVYLLRLQHNNALVSICLKPNPDIPEDTNIIPFPISKNYTKQGTLDGKFGTESDKDYPQAITSYGEYSYFKPKESYRLKKQIEREQQQSASYYQDFNTHSVDGRLKAAASVTGVQQLGNLVPFYGPMMNSVLNQALGPVATQQTYNDIELSEGISKKLAQRNLVNNYVWTIEGGFFAESTQVAETQQEIYSNDFNLSLGGDLGLKYEASGGVGFEQEATFGSETSVSVTKTKSKETGKSFELNISVDIPTTPRLSSISAGTVDAYRFMSFYLGPQKQNYEDLFTKVIDPIWLAESDDTNAQALRSARNDAKKPYCWRVMHRTTYVSRVLPEFNDCAPMSLEKAMQAKNIQSNYMLIKLFEPHVGNIADYDAFIKKVDWVIEQKLPEFRDFHLEIKGYLQAYFGLYSDQDKSAFASENSNIELMAPAQIEYQVANSEVTVDWNPVIGASEYVMGVFAKNAGTLTTQIISETQGAFTIGNDAESYRVKVMAKNIRKQSPWSKAVAIENIVLEAPKNLTSVVTGTQATVSWVAVPHANNYTVQVQGPEQTEIFETDSVNCTFDVHSGDFIVSVQAHRGEDKGPPSEALTISIDYLATPDNLTYCLDDTDIELSWGAVDNATSYTIEEVNEAHTEVVQTITTTEPKYSFKVHKEKHFVRVQASNSLQQSHWTDIYEMDDFALETPFNLTFQRSGESVTVSWSVIDGAHCYEWQANQVKYDDSVDDCDELEGTATNGSFTFTPKAGTYEIRVKARNPTRESDWSGKLVIVSIPSAAPIKPRTLNSIKSEEIYRIPGDTSNDKKLVCGDCWISDSGLESRNVAVMVKRNNWHNFVEEKKAKNNEDCSLYNKPDDFNSLQFINGARRCYLYVAYKSLYVRDMDNSVNKRLIVGAFTFKLNAQNNLLVTLHGESVRLHVFDNAELTVKQIAQCNLSFKVERDELYWADKFPLQQLLGMSQDGKTVLVSGGKKRDFIAVINMETNTETKVTIPGDKTQSYDPYIYDNGRKIAVCVRKYRSGVSPPIEYGYVLLMDIADSTINKLEAGSVIRLEMTPDERYLFITERGSTYFCVYDVINKESKYFYLSNSRLTNRAQLSADNNHLTVMSIPANNIHASGPGTLSVHEVVWDD